MYLVLNPKNNTEEYLPAFLVEGYISQCDKKKSYSTAKINNTTVIYKNKNPQFVLRKINNPPKVDHEAVSDGNNLAAG